MNLTVGGANRYYVVINRLYLSVKLFPTQKLFFGSKNIQADKQCFSYYIFLVHNVLLCFQYNIISVFCQYDEIFLHG